MKRKSLSHQRDAWGLRKSQVPHGKRFTLIERVPMRRMFLIDREESIPPIVQFGRIA